MKFGAKNNKKGAAKGVMMGAFLVVALLVLFALVLVWIISYIVNALLFCIPLFTQECAEPGAGYYKQPVEDEKIVDLSLSMMKMRKDFAEVGAKDYMHMKSSNIGHVSQYKEEHVPGITLSSAEQSEVVKISDEEDEKEEEEIKEEEEEEKVVFNVDLYKITDKISFDKKLVEDRLKKAVPAQKGRSNYFRESKNKDVLDWIIEAAADERFGAGIDPVFMVSITLHETGNGRSELLWNSNNPGGIRNVSSTSKALFKNEYGIEIMDGLNGRNFSRFKNLKEGIQYKAWLIRNGYIDQGLVTIPEFKSKYAPSSDAADTNNLNDNWTRIVHYFMNSFGVYNLGDGSVPSVLIEGAKRPDFEQYEIGKQIIYKGKFYNIKDFIKTSEEYRGNLKEEFLVKNDDFDYLYKKFIALSDEDEKTLLENIGVEEIEHDKAMEIYINYEEDEDEGPYFTEVRISEAELHLRTLLQFDLRGFDGGKDWIEYETGYALNRAYRMLENKTSSEYDFYVDNGEGELNEETFNADRDFFFEVLELEGVLELHGFENMATDLVAVEILSNNSALRNDVYSLAADHNIMYPFIVRGIGDFPDGYSKTLEEDIISAREKYVEELDNKLLSAVSVGHFYKEYSIELFKVYVDERLGEEAKSLSAYLFGGGGSVARDQIFKGRYVGKFRERVRSEYDKVLNGVTEQESEATTWMEGAIEVVTNAWENGIWAGTKWVADVAFTIPEYKKDKYIDNAISESEFIRFAMYRDTHEMAEIGSYVKNLCFYGLYHDMNLRTEYLANDDYDYTENKQRFSNYDSDICRYLNAYSVEEGYLSWEHTDVLDKSKAETSVEYRRVSLIPEEEAKLQELEYEYSTIEGLLTDVEYSELGAKIRNKNNLADSYKTEIDAIETLVLRGMIFPEQGQIIIDRRKSEISVLNGEVKEIEAERVEAEKIRIKAQKLMDKINAQKAKIAGMKEREAELVAIRASAMKNALNGAKNMGTKCFSGGDCEIPRIEPTSKFDAIKMMLGLIPSSNVSVPKTMDVYKDWHTGEKTDLVDLEKSLSDESPSDSDLEKIYFEISGTYYESILKYDSYMTDAEKTKIQNLANKINAVNSEYKDAKNTYRFDYAKAMLIYMPEDFTVAIFNKEGVAVGEIKKGTNNDIISGRLIFEFVDIENNSERSVILDEPLYPNQEKYIVERVESSYQLSYEPYYQNIFDIYMLAVNHSLKTINYTEYSLEKDEEIVAQFKEDSFSSFQMMTGMDFLRNEAFIAEFREWMAKSESVPPKGSDNFTVGGGRSYSNQVGQNPIYDPSYFQGIDFGIPIQTNGAKMRITSLRGQRNGDLHAGIDIGRHNWQQTMLISVTGEGKVIHSGWTNGFGYNVLVEHQGPKGVFYVRYAHIAPGGLRAKAGEIVVKGQDIGIMGNTGNSRGIHLHLNVYQGGLGNAANTVDPMPALGYTSEVVKCEPYLIGDCMSRYGWN